MKKVLFVASVVKTHIMQFHIPYLQMFREAGFETAVAAKNDYENPKDCSIPYCGQYFDVPFHRSPLSLGNIAAYRKLKAIIDSGSYDLIHCHTPVAAILTRLAARNARKKGTRVLYTAHGFHFYKGAPLMNWLLFYPIERIMSRYTDALITINREDYQRAEHFRAKKLYYVPGIGVDTAKFTANPALGTEKRRELGIGADKFVILTVAELIKRKNYRTAIRAIAEIGKKDPEKYSRIVYLICGRGRLDAKLRQLADDCGVSDHIRFLGYRSDIPELCSASDLFVFLSVQEGLPVALMESMSCGVPAVCLAIRGNTDIVTDGKNGLFTENDPSNAANNILRFMRDDALRAKLSGNASEIRERFSLEKIKEEMQRIYNDTSCGN